MHLYEVPLLLTLVGLVLYTVLGGADFGAGLWQLTAGRGHAAERLREQAHKSMGPVWEANHVWLIFVLVVMWTAYPVAFASIASTLVVPLFIAAVGIILRGTAYALRSGASGPREVAGIDTLFALSSILTPFALGAAVGGIASERVPVGNAAGDLFSTWLNPTSILVGTLAVAASAYLAAVYLSADARRIGDRDLEDRFRVRALGAGVVAGGIAVAGLIVLHSDAESVYDGLTGGAGAVALAASIAAGLATLALVWRRRFEPARYSAAAAVAAIIAGWALAQEPVLLPGLTVQEAAAPDTTLVALLVALAAGSVVLLPSLVVLFRLFLGGWFDRPPAAEPRPRSGLDVLSASSRGLVERSAIACLLAGFGFLTVAEAGWANAIGVVALVAFVALGFVAFVLPELAGDAGAEANTGIGSGGPDTA
jgi:cytochrome bd ubiquinol oxidase subunit II